MYIAISLSSFDVFGQDSLNHEIWDLAGNNLID